MDEDAIRKELEHSGDDEDYLSDLDEEFRDLSSEEDNGVNQVSRAEPSCKKARISVRTLSVDSEDSEEEICVERTERHVVKSDSDSETNVAVGGVSGCAGGDDGNGEETESNGADCEHDDANLDVSGTGDIIIQGKATAQARNSYKNVTLKDSDPPRLNHSLGQKTIGPQVPVNCVTPLQFFMLFFTSEMIKKITAETNAYAKEKIANKTVSRFSIWHEWYDVVEEEMLAFLGLIINMGVIHLPYLKDYWSQQFVCRVPFFGEVFTRKRFLQIFWMLHLETVSTSDHSLRTRTQKVSNFLKYIDARFREHFIPGQNLSVDESVVGFKGKISFITYNPKKPTKWGIRVYVLADSATSYVCTFIPYHGKITTESLIKPDLPFTSRIVLQLFHNIRQTWPDISGYHIFTD